MMQLFPSQVQCAASWFMPKLWPISWATMVETKPTPMPLNCQKTPTTFSTYILNGLYTLIYYAELKINVIDQYYQNNYVHQQLKEIWHARIIQVKLIVYDLYKEEGQFNLIILSDGIQYTDVIFSVHQEVKHWMWHSKRCFLSFKGKHHFTSQWKQMSGI